MSGIVEALAALERGELVVLPTDTVYGVASALAGSIERLFEVKGRPADKPIPVLGATAGDLSRIVDLDERALALAERFWPGPLTLVLPRAAGFTIDLGGDSPGVAVRIPSHRLTATLLDASGPLAVTSANRTGEPPAQTVEAARRALGDDVDVYLDGGPSQGIASTVVSLIAEVEILRTGPIGEDALREVLV